MTISHSLITITRLSMKGAFVASSK